jgi:hypothetical protein
MLVNRKPCDGWIVGDYRGPGGYYDRAARTRGVRNLLLSKTDETAEQLGTAEVQGQFACLGGPCLGSVFYRRFILLRRPSLGSCEGRPSP